MTDRNDERTDEESVIEEEYIADDDPELTDIEADSKTKLKKLRDDLTIAQEEKRAALEELQRAKADFLNAKSRLNSERETDKKRSRLAHIEELLPLCDSFDMAMANQEAWNEAPEQWRRGVEGIFNQLQSLLSSYQVAAIDPVGEPFDPNHHEALGHEPVTDAAKADTVVRTVQKGYAMKDGEALTVIRPPRVMVGSHD